MAIFAIVILAIGSALFAASRHTKDTAVARWNITLAEGQTLTKEILCYDPDGDANITMTLDGTLPAGATLGAVVAQPAGFTDPGQAELPVAETGSKWYTRSFTWTPGYTQAGTYTFYINAKDPTLDEDWAKYTITVTNVNRPPVL